MPRTVDILEHWLARRAISPAEHEAGERLRRTFDLAVKDGIDGRGAVPPDVSAEARVALKRLLPLLGEVDQHVVVAVLCRGFTADDALRAFGRFELRDDEDVCRRVRKALAQLRRHRWGETREVPPVGIPETMQVNPAGVTRTVTLTA